MGAKTNYTLVGLSVLMLSIGALMVFLWLSVGFDKTVYQTFSVYMNEPVNGLNVKSVVKFNGVDVGNIKSISINKKNPQQVLLLINIDETVPISVSTIAVLESQGMTGLRYLALEVGNGTTDSLEKKLGEPYPVIRSKPSLFIQLNTMLTGVTENFNKMTDSINIILDKENAKTIKSSLHNIDNFTSILSKQSEQLSLIIDNVNVLVKNSVIASKKLPELMQTISNSSDALSQTMQVSHRVIKQIDNRTLPKANSLMNDFDVLTKQLNRFTKELKKNPSMLLRGRAQRQLGPGE